jgi:hypothetical protein
VVIEGLAELKVAENGPEFEEVITRPPVTVIVKVTVPLTGVVAESVAVTVN